MNKQEIQNVVNTLKKKNVDKNELDRNYRWRELGEEALESLLKLRSGYDKEEAVNIVEKSLSLFARELLGETLSSKIHQKVKWVSEDKSTEELKDDLEHMWDLLQERFNTLKNSSFFDKLSCCGDNKKKPVSVNKPY